MIQNKPYRYELTPLEEKRLKAIKPHIILRDGIIIRQDVSPDTHKPLNIIEKPVAPLRLIQHICYTLHNSTFHQGITRTARLIEKLYYRPKMFGIPSLQKWIKDYIYDCELCAQKVSVHTSHPFPMLLNPIPTKPRMIYMMDYWGPCSKSVEIEVVNNIRRYTGREFSHILVAKDIFSGLIYLRPTEKQTGNEVVELLTTIISEQGVPIAIRSDNHSVFKSKILEQTCERLNIKHHFPIAYRPQSQATVERVMIQISDALKTESKKDGWHKLVPYIQLVLNNSYNRILDDSSYHIHYGVDAILPNQIICPNNDTLPNPKRYGKELQENLTKIQKEILPRIIKNRIKEHNYFNNKITKQREINVGDVVQIKLPLPKSTASKNNSVWIGYFRVLKIENRECTVRTKGGRKEYITHLDRVIRVSNQFNKKLCHWLKAQEKYKTEMEKIEIKEEDDEYKLQNNKNENEKEESTKEKKTTTLLAIEDVPHTTYNTTNTSNNTPNKKTPEIAKMKTTFTRNDIIHNNDTKDKQTPYYTINYLW